MDFRSDFEAIITCTNFMSSSRLVRYYLNEYSSIQSNLSDFNEIQHMSERLIKIYHILADVQLMQSKVAGSFIQADMFL